MSKADYEAYIVVIGHRHGQRYAERRYLNVPLDLATDNIERLSDLQLREAMNNLKAERERRDEAARKRKRVKAATGNYDPVASQIRRAA